MILSALRAAIRLEREPWRRSRRALSSSDHRLTPSLDAFERHLAENLLAGAGAPGVTVLASDEIVERSTEGSVWGNVAMRARFRHPAAAGAEDGGRRRRSGAARRRDPPPDVLDRRLEELVERYRSTGRGSGFWIGPDSRPTDLGRRLARLGYRCRKRFPAMAVALDDLPPAARPGANPPGLVVEALADPTTFLRLGHPFFGRPNTPLRRSELGRVVYLAGEGERPLRHWVGWLESDGQRRLVASAACQIAGGLASVHDVGVLPEARRRGIGGAVMRALLAGAGALGARTAALLATGDGEALYRALGFVEIGRLAYWFRGAGSTGGNPRRGRRP